MRLRWPANVSWSAIVVCGLITLGLGFLIVSTANGKSVDLIGKGLLLLVGGGVVWAALRSSTTGGGPVWRSTKSLAALLLAFTAAFGVLSDAMGLIDPRPAIESEPGKIERNTDRILASLPQRPESAILEAIPGLWGEPGCKVAYRFSVIDRALAIEAERRPMGSAPWRLVATIVGANDDRADVVVEEPAEARGRAASFTLDDNGITRRLTWIDRSREAPLILDAC